MRACPRDGTTLELDETTFVTTDVCPLCQGTYYDRDETQTALTAGADLALLVRDALAKQEPGPSIPCPGCGATMATFHIARKEDGATASGPFRLSETARGIALEFCSGCGGTWVDGGHGGKLGDLSATAEEQRQRSHVPRGRGIFGRIAAWLSAK